jgi:hypothetical protein
MLQINPDAATRDDIARMAEELTEMRAAVEEASTWLPWHEPDHQGYQPGKSDIGRKLRNILSNP